MKPNTRDGHHSHETRPCWATRGSSGSLSTVSSDALLHATPQGVIVTQSVSILSSISTRISDWPGQLHHWHEQCLLTSSRGPPWWSRHPGTMTRDSVTHLETPSLRNKLNAERDESATGPRVYSGEVMIPDHDDASRARNTGRNRIPPASLECSTPFASPV